MLFWAASKSLVQVWVYPLLLWYLFTRHTSLELYSTFAIYLDISSSSFFLSFIFPFLDMYLSEKKNGVFLKDSRCPISRGERYETIAIFEYVLPFGHLSFPLAVTPNIRRIERWRDKLNTCISPLISPVRTKKKYKAKARETLLSYPFLVYMFCYEYLTLLL